MFFLLDLIVLKENNAFSKHFLSLQQVPVSSPWSSHPMRNWLLISHSKKKHCLDVARDKTREEKKECLVFFIPSSGSCWSDIDCLTLVKYSTLHCGWMLIGVEGVGGEQSDRAHERGWLGLSPVRDVSLIWMPFSVTGMKQMFWLLTLAYPECFCTTCS